MLTVHVKLFATLVRDRPGWRHGQAVAVPVPPGDDLGRVLARLDLPPDLVHHVFVNGRRRSLDYVPQDGDELAVFPPIAGG
jgi:molybdopterin converting factor small subunit